MRPTHHDDPSARWRLGALDRLTAQHQSPDVKGSQESADAPTQALHLPRRPAVPGRVRLPASNPPGSPEPLTEPGPSKTRLPRQSAEVQRRVAPSPQLRDLPAPPTTADYTRLSRRPAVSTWRAASARIARALRSDSTPAELVDAATVIQQPVTTGRRVIVVGAAGGVGTTTLACAVASVLGRLRTDPVTLVAGAEQAAAVAARLGGAAGPLIDAWQWSVRSGEGQAEAFSQISRNNAITVVDGGSSPAAELLRAAHVIVIAVPMTADSGLRAETTVQRIRGMASEPRFVLVPIDSGRDTGASLATVRRTLPEGETAIAVPADRHLAGAAAINLEICAEQTCIALHQLTAAVIGKATQA